MKARQERYIKKHPKVIKAYILSKNIVVGKCCSIFNSVDRLEKHHPDYSKPLYIITLCKKCHTRIHNPQMEVIIR